MVGVPNELDVNGWATSGRILPIVHDDVQVIEVDSD